MADRNLVHYEEERNSEGPYWTLDIERSAAGQPGLLFTIESKAFSESDRHIEALNRQMTIVVRDGNALLAPVLEWLGRKTAASIETMEGARGWLREATETLNDALRDYNQARRLIAQYEGEAELTQEARSGA